MTQKLLKTVANFSTTLALKVTATDTSLTLTTATDQDGNTLPDGTYGFTINEGQSNEEHIVGVVSGTAVTSLVRNIQRNDGLTAQTGLTHRKGDSIKITNFPSLKRIENILDGTTDLDSGTPLKYDGTPSITAQDEIATKKYVDDTATGSTTYDQEIQSGVLGETIVTGEYVYLKSDGKWWKTDASVSSTSENVKVGVAQAGGSADDSVGILTGGLDKTQTYTAGSKYYLSDTAGDVSTSKGTIEVFVGEGNSDNHLVFQHLSNIETLTADEKDALAGVSGITPASDNKYVDNADTTVGATITGTTIAFVDSNPDTLTDSGNGFVTAGFKTGDSITVSGSTSNDGTYTIKSVVAETITLIAGDSLTDEVAGDTVTITADVTSKVVRMTSDDKLPALDGSNLTGNPALSGENITDISLKAGMVVGEDIDGSSTPIPVVVDNASSSLDDVLLNPNGQNTQSDDIDSSTKQSGQTFIIPEGYNRLKSITLSVNDTGSGNDYDWQFDIYTVDTSHKPTGASLGTVIKVMDGQGTGEFTVTFASAIEVTENTEYAVVIKPVNISTLDASNYHSIRGANTSTSAGYSLYSSDSGSTWTTDADDLNIGVSGGFVGSGVGRVIKANAGSSDRNGRVVGFVNENISDEASANVMFGNVLGGFTGLTAGSKYYVSNTVGAISTSAGTAKVLVGIAISTTELFISVQEEDTNL